MSFVLLTAGPADAQGPGSRPEDIPDLRQHANEEKGRPSGRVRIRFAQDSQPTGWIDMSYNYKHGLPLGLTLIADEMQPGSSSYGPLTAPTRFRLTLKPPEGRWKGQWKDPEPHRSLVGVYRGVELQEMYEGGEGALVEEVVEDASEGKNSRFIEFQPGEKQRFIDLRMAQELNRDSIWARNDQLTTRVEQDLFLKEMAASQSLIYGSKNHLGNLRATLEVEAYRQTRDGREVVGTYRPQIRVTHFGEILGFIHPPLHGSQAGIEIERIHRRAGTREAVHEFTAEQLADGSTRSLMPIALMPDDILWLGANDGAYMRFLLDDIDVNWMVMGNPRVLTGPHQRAPIRLGMLREANEGQGHQFVANPGFRGIVPCALALGASMIVATSDMDPVMKKVGAGFVFVTVLLPVGIEKGGDYLLSEDPKVIWRQTRPIRVGLKSVLAVTHDKGGSKLYLIEGEANVSDFGRQFVKLKGGQYMTTAGPNAFKPQAFDDDSLPTHVQEMYVAMKARRSTVGGERPEPETPSGEDPRQESTQSEKPLEEVRRTETLRGENRQDEQPAKEPHRQAVRELRRRGVSLDIEDGVVYEVDFTKTELREADLKHLRALDTSDCGALGLRGARVTDAIAEDIAAMKELMILELNETKITDKTLGAISHLRQLHLLSLKGAPVTDAGIKKLAANKSIEVLHLDGTRVTDACLPTLVGMKSLKIVHATGTGITIKGIEQARRQRPGLAILAF